MHVILRFVSFAAIKTWISHYSLHSVERRQMIAMFRDLRDYRADRFITKLLWFLRSLTDAS